MKIIAIDPGLMSGFCYANITPEGELRYFPFQMNDEVDDLWRRLKDFKPSFIVMEDFEFRGKARTGLNLFPVQLIGVARLYAELATEPQCQIRLQKAMQAKGYYTDAVLKQMKLYKKSTAHGMDATRHLLQWWTFGPGFKYNNGEQNNIHILDKWLGGQHDAA